MRVAFFYGYEIKIKSKLLNILESEPIKMFKLTQP